MPGRKRYIYRKLLLTTLSAAAIFYLEGIAFAEDLYSDDGVIRPETRMKAPLVELNSLDGSLKKLDDFSGKVILLNFWATWCKPCRDEMPSMERLWKKLGSHGLVIIAINADKGSIERVAKKVGKFVDESGVNFPVLLDINGKTRRRYEITALPTSYIIGRDGKFSGKIIGPREWDGPELLKYFENLLE